MKQRTLLREVSIKGNALHTGDAVHMTFKPAPANHGIVFKRVDLHGQPEIKPRVDLVTDLVRATTIQQGHAKIHTVEHVLSALSGCGIDNLMIEMNAGEPPIMDGSAREFVKMIQQGEPVEQDAEREAGGAAALVTAARSAGGAQPAFPSAIIRASVARSRTRASSWPRRSSCTIVRPVARATR